MTEVQRGTAPHCHDIGCCWDCFHGRQMHPRVFEDGDPDLDCERERAEHGDASDCVRADRTETP